MKSEQKKRQSNKLQLIIPAFLFKTYQILEDPQYFDIISWNEEGNAFIIKKVNEFAEQLLPKFFKHNNYASFVRQLNMYDFHKTRSETTENEFKHKLFRRGYKYGNSNIQKPSLSNKTENFRSQSQLGLGSQFERQSIYNGGGMEVNLTKLINLRNKQEFIEKVCQILLNQHAKLLNENKLLHNQIIKNKTKNDRTIEKIMMVLSSNVLPELDGNDSTLELLNDHLQESRDITSQIEKWQDQNLQKSFMKRLKDVTSMKNSIKSKNSRRTRSRKFSESDDEDESFDRILKKFKVPQDDDNGFKLQTLCLMDQPEEQPPQPIPTLTQQYSNYVEPLNVAEQTQNWGQEIEVPEPTDPVDDYENFL